MPRYLRMFKQAQVYHVTNRTKQGLPFVANEYIRLLISGIITRTLELYPSISLCHGLLMTNHFHLILITKGDPKDLSCFMRYFQSEVSSLIHRLTGVTHDNLWMSRYKHQALLTPEAVIEKISYTYLNPIKANLVDSIEHWEGFNTWDQFLDGDTRQYKWFSDASVSRLPHTKFNPNMIEVLCAELHADERRFREMNIDPYLWKTCFKESRNWSEQEIKNIIVAKVKNGEKKFREERIRKGENVAGKAALRCQSIYKKFKSKDYRKTPLAPALKLLSYTKKNTKISVNFVRLLGSHGRSLISLFNTPLVLLSLLNLQILAFWPGLRLLCKKAVSNEL